MNRPYIICHMTTYMHCIVEQEIFAYAFRLGGKLMLAVMVNFGKSEQNRKRPHSRFYPLVWSLLCRRPKRIGQKLVFLLIPNRNSLLSAVLLCFYSTSVFTLNNDFCAVTSP